MHIYYNNRYNLYFQINYNKIKYIYYKILKEIYSQDKHIISKKMILNIKNEINLSLKK